MKVFGKMQRSGKIEVDKDLEEKLGFSLTAMPKNEDNGVARRYQKTAQLLLQNDHTPFLVGLLRPQTAGAKRRKEAFKHIANKKQTDKIVQSRNSSADSNPRRTKRPQSAMPSRRGRKGEKLSKTVSSSAERAENCRCVEKKASKQRMSKTIRCS